jgi:outer membrane protein TolC
MFQLLYTQQDSVSLIQCFRAARENAAIKPQLEIIKAISELKTDNAAATNLPVLSAYGKAWYQSDATSITIPISQTERKVVDINQFQYNFGLEADQKLYDGGVSRMTSKLEIASEEADRNKLETDLYQLNDKVGRYFFTALLYDENKKVLGLKQELLQKRILEIGSGVKNGIIKSSELDKIKAEALLTQQQIIELDKGKMQTINALQIIIGQPVSNNAILYVPDSLTIFASSIRPEYKYFDAEIKRIDKSVNLKSTQNLPKLYAFGQLGYSYPGLDFFQNTSSYYYFVGAKLSWTIFDWKQVNREKQVLRKQSEIIDSKRTDFDRNMKISIQNEQIEQEKLLQLIEIDKQIIDQRSLISASSASSLANGVITSTVYLEDLNAEMKARVDLETHGVQYMNSVVKLYLLNGIDINK